MWNSKFLRSLLCTIFFVFIARCFSADFSNEEKVYLPQKSFYKNFIFDLGDVLISVNKKTIQEQESDLNLSFKEIIRHSAWQDLERGFIEKPEAYLKISKDTGYGLKQINQLIDIAKSSLIINKDLVEILPILKSQGKKLYCLTNIPKEDMTHLRYSNDFFDYFDIIFSSGFIGMRKPNLDIFKYVVNFCNIDPIETIFIDDNESNIRAAETLGIKSILFTSGEMSNHIDDIKILADAVLPIGRIMENPQSKEGNIVKNKILSAYNYINENINKFGILDTFIGKGVDLEDVKVSPVEIFSSALALTLSKELAFHSFGNNALKLFFSKISADGLSHYFLEVEKYPCDVDTTSVILALLYEHNLVDINTVHRAIGQILSNINEQGIIRTFFDSRTRIDAVACANALYLIYLANRQDDILLKNTKEYIINYVITGQGSPYYTSEGLGLYLVVRLYNKFPDCFRFLNNFKELLTEKINNNRILISKKDAMGLASTLLTCDLLGLTNEKDDYEELALLQESDGSWPLSSIYMANSFFGHKVHFANKGLNTAFSMKALEARMRKSIT